MKRHLPSITSLRAFEATARHLSFTRAAIELNLTQTAVSHQIKTLEGLLGVRLFVREPNGVQLTDTGRDYLSAISPAMFEIVSATNRVGDAVSENILHVACLGTYAIKCLIPNLSKFRMRYPDITLRMTTLKSFEEIVRHNYDVAIRYGDGRWPRMLADKIADEEIFPICSPTLLNSDRPLRHLDDLRRHTIIRTESPVLRDYWDLWVETAGGKSMEFSNEISCDSLATTIQAAMDGLGVALARSSVTKVELASGRLVEPFTVRFPCAFEGYYVVTFPELADLHKVKAFRSWVLGGYG
jgi:LysR family transcriptional regulator, glycine cleavage system transcriptional activator